VQATDPIYDRTRVDYSADQRVAQSLPALYTDLAVSDHEGGSFSGLHLPLLNPLEDQHHTEERFSSATPERNHDYYERKEQIFSDPNRTRPPYPTTVEFPQPTLTVARRPSARRHTSASVSGPSCGARSGVTGPPAGSTLVNDIGFQTPKKRKPTVTLDETRKVKRIRRKRSQRLDPRGLTLVGIFYITQTHS
jgi:hypothetical protein